MKRYAKARASTGVAAILNLLAGFLLYWQVNGGLSMSRITSGQGWTLTIGAAAGIAAFLIGALVMGRKDREMESIVEEFESAGQSATAEQMQQLQAAKAALFRSALWASILLVIAVMGMASFQFVPF